MYSPKKLLLTKIERVRKKLIEVACKRGFTSTESLLLSQELDELLNIYNCMSRITIDVKELGYAYENKKAVI